jgi:hypothetical protein
MPIKEIVHAAQKGKLALFCGAGISMLPPSKSPS